MDCATYGVGSGAKKKGRPYARLLAYHVFDAVLLLFQGLLESVRLSEIPAGVDEHDSAALRLNETAAETYTSARV